jgi:hypothetical protein
MARNRPDTLWIRSPAQPCSGLRADAGAAAMPIRPFLAGSAFAPETIRVMSIAFEGVCEDLGLRMRDDDATRLVAEKIIKFAKWGIRDAATLRALTLKEFRPDS